MKLSQFKFAFNEALIAKHPTDARDESKLMVIHRESGKIEHKKFSDILGMFNDGDVMVLNNTKVFPARLYGSKEKTGAKIEVFLLRELNKEMKLWDVLVDPARKIRVGNKLYEGWLKESKKDPKAFAHAALYRNRPEFELFSIKDDMYELNNLANDPSLQKVKNNLFEVLKKWMAEQGDKGIDTEWEALSHFKTDTLNWKSDAD
jgi:S-adenosylmethionine:tRNA-ribosyltransferase-isomerase (queuine synthetase)